MKRIFSVLLCMIILSTTFSINGVIAVSDTKPTSQINIRDPFVLVHDGKYYMYGTGCSRGAGYGCYVSDDLKNWSGPFQVFTPPQGHTGDGCWWAPECHYYDGNFYLFATYHDSVLNHRGVGIFKSSSPLGPFVQISDGFITPHEWDAIDGTLYVDASGQPWMAFVHEWTCTDDGVGRMAAAKMSEDLSKFISQPVELFRADDGAATMNGDVTDGPFIYTRRDGKLLMLWSNFSALGYTVGIAESNSIDDGWVQQNKLLFSRNYSLDHHDGGHGMIFTTLEGKTMLALHSPNGKTDDCFETARFLEIIETDGTLMLKTQYDKQQQISKAVSSLTAAVAKALSAFWAIVVSIFISLL